MGEILRRPIVAVLLGFAGGILVTYYQGIYLALGIGILLLLVTGFCAVRITDPLRATLLISCGFFLLGSCCLQYSLGKEGSFYGREGEKVRIRGQVITAQSKQEGFTKLILRVEEEWRRQESDSDKLIPLSPEKVLVNISGVMKYDSLELLSEKGQDRQNLTGTADLVGRWVEVTGTVEAPSPMRNPKTFDYALYMKTQGITSLINSKSYDLQMTPHETQVFSNKLSLLKASFIKRLHSISDENSTAILVGMLLGDKSLLEESTYENFQKNGIAHILSVSGIHVGILYLCINKLLGKRRTPVYFLSVGAFLLFYAALAEFSPSVTRAVAMIFIHLLSKLLFRPYDLTACTCTCAVIMLCINPMSLFQVGFQLSYLAVFTLAVLLPWTNRRIALLEEKGLSPALNKVLKFLAPLLVIQVGMAPFTAYCFNYFSISAFLLNIPVLFLAGFIIPLGVMAMVLSFLADFLGEMERVPLIMTYIMESFFRFLVFLDQILIQIMNFGNTVFGSSSLSYFLMASPPMVWIALYYGLLFFLFSELFRVMYQRKQWKKVGCVLSVILIVSLLFPHLSGEVRVKPGLVFVDVGQGDCLHIKTPKGKNILIDGGGSQNYNVGKKTLMPYLLKNGISKIDLVLVTHLHDDHYLGIQQLGKEYPISNLGFYEINQLRAKEIEAKSGIPCEKYIYLSKGQTLKIEKDISIEVLYPEKKSQAEYESLLSAKGDENESSLILKINYGELSVLMTGDMGFDGEEKLMKLHGGDGAEGNFLPALQSHILKVGHHGSKYSTSETFVNVVNPKLAIIQVGKNNFGHPNQDVIENLEKSSIMVYRNDQQGAILLEAGKGWKLRSTIP